MQSGRAVLQEPFASVQGWDVGVNPYGMLPTGSRLTSVYFRGRVICQGFKSVADHQGANEKPSEKQTRSDRTALARQMPIWWRDGQGE